MRGDGRCCNAFLSRVACVNAGMVEDLCQSVQRASNLLVLNGVVNAENAPRVLGVLTNAVTLLSETQMCPGSILASGIEVRNRLGSTVPSTLVASSLYLPLTRRRLFLCLCLCLCAVYRSLGQ
jgi:hypothetical protein